MVSIEGFGECTKADIKELDRALAAMRVADDRHQDTRRKAGEIVGKLMQKGAQRKALARHMGVHEQTVTFMVNGRPSRSEMRSRANGSQAVAK